MSLQYPKSQDNKLVTETCNRRDRDDTWNIRDRDQVSLIRAPIL